MRDIDYEKTLFESQNKFFLTLRKEHITDIYFHLLKYIDIICLYRKIVDVEERKFIRESLTSEIIDNMLDTGFKIETSWKAYIYKRMNHFIEDYHSQDSLHRYEKNKRGSDGETIEGDFFDMIIDPRDYKFLDVDLDRNGVILRVIRKMVNRVRDVCLDFFDPDPYLFRYYFYLVTFNNSLDCLDDLNSKQKELKQILIFAYNLYTFKLKEFLINSESSISDDLIEGDKP